ncbi:MAG: D-alanyl-D-alanine carboxypeptidase, partial [Planctomycetota bacterium]|nr:D-alanyl-D-alanine carboxypeptidase [Planctomycetota bacterium]
MDPERGRRTPAATARLTVAGAFGVALLVLLWILAGGARSEEEPEVQAAAVAGQAPLGRPTTTGDAQERTRCEEALRGIVARWIEAAAKRTDGRAGGKAGSAHVRVAVHARILDPESGGTLAAIGSDRVMRPASNMKLVTTAAALVLLGADWSFTTDFEAGGPIEDDALRGDLVVRAAGDPLQDPDGKGRAEERLGRFARDLRARGIAEVTGDLVL